jgi:hypothetical protein
VIFFLLLFLTNVATPWPASDPAMTPGGDEAAASAVKVHETQCEFWLLKIEISPLYGMVVRNVPIVEKNDLSPHSATKTKTNVLARVLATDTIPAPFPENFETASSACHCSV